MAMMVLVSFPRKTFRRNSEVLGTKMVKFGNTQKKH